MLLLVSRSMTSCGSRTLFGLLDELGHHRGGHLRGPTRTLVGLAQAQVGDGFDRTPERGEPMGYHGASAADRRGDQFYARLERNGGSGLT